MYRTHNCGNIGKKDIGKKIILSGWISSIRNLGSVIFIDLRDYYGITQLIFYKKKFCKKINNLSREFVIQIKGKVIERISKNIKNPTGEIEIVVSKIDILNTSLTPPFTIENNSDGNEELRMKYRYLDIRREKIKNKIFLRHKISMEIRNYLSKINFIEIETPMLIKPTPEGARDFIIPSRLNTGKFYSLPQSPQFFKQLLMIGGIDKYFQIVKCFRDEDYRSDRQPEFTQIDCEMSFVKEEDILKTFEKFIIHLFKKICGITFSKSFLRITYKDAISNYGSDKPDIRFKMTIKKLNNIIKIKNSFLFKPNDFIGGIVLPNCANYTRKQIENIISLANSSKIGANILIWVKYLSNNNFKSSINKYFKQEEFKEWAFEMKAKEGDLLLILFGEEIKTKKQLGKLRIEMGKKLGLIDSKKISPLWIIDFPLLEKIENKKKYKSFHHPFTSPKEKNISFIKKYPDKVLAQSYDLVINGNEIGGGSIRINKSKLQEQIFSILGLSKKKIYKEFGFFINALKYGAPPHGGIAFGLDRLISILSGKENIKEFIAFPKNNSGKDLMINSPSNIEKNILKELKLKIKK